MSAINSSPEFQTWVKGLLHDSSVKNLRITFTKADGTEREMFCTLAEQLIPADKVPKGTGRETSSDTQHVFDLDKQEWRSFKWDSVIEVSCDVGD